MSDAPLLLPYRILSPSAFQQLRDVLTRWQETTNALGLTENLTAAAGQSLKTLWPETIEAFQLMVGSTFSVLIVSKLVQENGLPENSAAVGGAGYWTALVLEADIIEDFIKRLGGQLDATSPLQDLCHQMLVILQTNPPQVPGAFLLDVAASLDQARTLTHNGQAAHQALVCQPVQRALDQQLEQSLLLNQVINRIRQSLELPSILTTTVAEVREFLRADRLVIYQFEGQKVHPLSQGRMTSFDLNPPVQRDMKGYISYESRADETLPSVLHFSEEACFKALSSCHEHYLRGIPQTIDDVEASYPGLPCLLDFLRQAKVKAKLIVPILVRGELWGLLIAHQCDRTRHWQSWEVEFLQHIAEHLSVAISQAELYSQLQRQKQNLEDRVIERTQNLRDALVAAQTANRAKSEFLATMSHELRTPLTCIIGLSATLLRWSFGELSPRQREYLSTVHDSGERLLALINDILEVSKIESGRAVLEISEFSLSSLARQCLETFRTDAQDHEVAMHLDFQVSPAHDAFAADQKRVQQILQNLLSNAIKFTPPGGRVNLRVRLEQQMAVFQVEDTGIGIPESQHSLLFEKFQQLETTRQRQYAGTGLGLALTKQLVDLHGGSISVHSKVGTGSVFTVRLPRQRLGDAAKSPAYQEEPPLEPVVGRIVLVDENEEQAGIICDMLTAADYQVIWVIDGSRVVDQVELLQPVGVIVDVHLRRADGFDIINALRSYVATAAVKILALVDTTLPDAVSQARMAGADAILNKPMVPEDLLAKINALMTVPRRESGRTEGERQKAQGRRQL